MNGKEFIRRVRKIDKSRGSACSVGEARGKGSHITLYLGDNLTIVRNPKDDLKTGTFQSSFVSQVTKSWEQNMTRMIYPINLTPDTIDGGFTVTCRDFPEAITQAETMTEAVIEASDAIEEAIASCMKRNTDIPEPSNKKQGEYMATVPLSTSLKAALYSAMREDGVSKSELARRMSIDEKEVRRMLDPGHPSKTPGMERALSCLGRSVVAEFTKAA